MSDTDKLGLFMGNHIPAINHISNEYTIIQNWRTAFLEAADSPLNKLWKKRAQLIVETFPEWSISSSDVHYSPTPRRLIQLCGYVAVHAQNDMPSLSIWLHQTKRSSLAQVYVNVTCIKYRYTTVYIYMLNVMVVVTLPSYYTFPTPLACARYVSAHFRHVEGTRTR